MTIEVSPVLFRKSSVNFSITTVWLNAGHIYTMSVKPDNPSKWVRTLPKLPSVTIALIMSHVVYMTYPSPSITARLRSSTP